MSTSLSRNLCPKCHNPIRIPEEDVVVVKMKTGLKGRQEDRMVHRVCAGIGGSSGQIAGQEYCSSCRHPATLHTPRCEYSVYGDKCDCKKFMTYYTCSMAPVLYICLV